MINLCINFPIFTTIIIGGKNMKKWIILFCSLFLVTGCDDLTNTPKKQAETFFNNYQILSKEVLEDLDDVVKEEVNFNTEQRDKYRNLMKKHYQALTYEIKDSEENGDRAVVTAEIEVYDYSKIIQENRSYLENNRNEFLDEDGDLDYIKYNDYRLEQLSKVKDKVKYTISLNLTKKDKKWILDEVEEATLDKIHGMYIY